MAEQNDKLDFSQPKNTLSEIAERERVVRSPHQTPNDCSNLADRKKICF